MTRTMIRTLKGHYVKFHHFIGSSPDFHIIKGARGATFQLKVCEVEHDLHVDLHYDFKDAITAHGIVVGVVG